MADYHIHPGYSIDAEDVSIEQYCRRAVDIGLDEICFTPHYELDPVRRDLDWYVRLGDKVVSMESSWLANYFNDIAQAREIFRGKLSIKAGIEVGYDHGLEEPINRLLDKYPFDFVLGSIHCLEHIAISSARESSAYYARQKCQDMCREYYFTLESCIKSRLFDVVGHFDIYRRHGYKHYGDDLYRIQKEYLGSILELMAEMGTGIEINTSGLKMGQEFYPCRDILVTAVNKGLKVFTTGSDAHSLDELGRGIETAEKILNSMGVAVSVFQARKALPYGK